MTEKPSSQAQSLPREFGEYTIRGELGRGAMGVVYDAVDRRLDRPVALKVLRTDLDPDSAAYERFRREARACASVRHENVVQIFEAGEVDGRPYYAMTRLHGESLATLAREGRLPEPRELLRRLAGVADALEVLHEGGIVHRDVKPSNILVDPDGKMVLADFGLAKAAASGDLTRTGEALGTPIYMSPEQALGKRDEVDGQTDIYSLGATIYEALAGRPVFDAEDTGGMMRQVLHDAPRPLRQIRPDVPRECESVVLKALEKEKRDRYATAKEMRDDLLAFSEGRPVAGRPVSRARKVFRRWKWHGLAAAGLLAAAVLASVLLLPSKTGAAPAENLLAKLEVLSTPAAWVLIDGEEAGRTPVTRELPPGDYSLVLRLPGFVERHQQVRLEGGQHRTLEWVLAAADPDDPVALGQYAQALALPCAALDEDELHELSELDVSPRGGTSDAPEPEQVAHLTTETLVQLLELGRLELGSAEAGHLMERVTSTKGELPEELRRALEGPDRIVWSTRDTEGGSDKLREMRIPRQVALTIERVEKRLGDLDPRVLCHLKAQVYLANGLDLHALLEADRLVRSGKASPQTLLVMKKALQRMGLTNCKQWKRVLSSLRRVPPAQRKTLLLPR